jgi:hypothetical protein
VALEAIWKSPQHLSSNFGMYQTLAVLGCGCSQSACEKYSLF